MGVFAEFERSMTVERVRSGVAKGQGEWHQELKASVPN